MYVLLLILFSCISQAFELVTGDSLFEPKAGEFISLEEGTLSTVLSLSD